MASKRKYNQNKVSQLIQSKSMQTHRLWMRNDNIRTKEMSDELKRLVESHELVEKYNNKHGGIRFLIRWCMYRYGNTQQFNDHLKQAIVDVESCK